MSAASSRPRPPARRTWLWVLGMLVCAFTLVAVHEFFIRSSTGQWLEQATLESRYWNITQGPLQNDTLREVLGAAPTVTAIIAGVIFLAITLLRQRFVGAGIAVAVFLGANITTQALKGVWIHRVDPDVPMSDPNMQLWWWDVASFPSGHATLAAAAAVAVFLVSAPHQRPFIGLFTGLLAVFSGAAIFMTGHFASDIIAAYLVVALWGLLGGWLVMRTGERWNTVTLEDDTAVGAGAGLAWFLGVVFCVAAGLALLFAGGWEAIRTAAQDPSGWHWLAGTLLPVGPGFLLCAAGITFFDAEAGRRHHGQSLHAPQQSDHPVPPQFTHLYEV
ncbi:phosphatase PAP2 family protein [Nesterenkonia xinjiangensis]|uniref:Membrane-associated phospholipid phosphatase n=1 Tax=Nesterenkonia xinjiangensis TaxID=225327 RepID=A0A7Z0K973_9MICC|nr:phosphatase PAP2 family protein [Nesterenkonia xinjiangensis]NYJ77493.1 membrane-associated phospholipid phosphatase [Nesterenkonia xinjiangensis]